MSAELKELLPPKPTGKQVAEHRRKKKTTIRIAHEELMVPWRDATITAVRKFSKSRQTLTRSDLGAMLIATLDVVESLHDKG